MKIGPNPYIATNSDCDDVLPGDWVEPKRRPIHWPDLKGKTLRIPLGYDRYGLGFVVWANDYGLMLYGFAAYSRAEIVALNGVLPPFGEALTFHRASGLFLAYDWWEIGESFGVRSILADLPTDLAYKGNSGRIDTYDSEDYDTCISYRPATFAEMRGLPNGGVFGSGAFVTHLTMLSSTYGETIRFVPNFGPAMPFEKEAIGPGLRPLEGEILSIPADPGRRAYAWVINQSGARVDCLYFRDDPASLPGELRERNLSSRAFSRQIRFAEDWLRAAADRSLGVTMDPNRLGSIRKPTKFRTEWEYPSGRHDFVHIYELADIHGCPQTSRVRPEDLYGLHDGSLPARY